MFVLYTIVMTINSEKLEKLKQLKDISQQTRIEILQILSTIQDFDTLNKFNYYRHMHVLQPKLSKMDVEESNRFFHLFLTEIEKKKDVNTPMDFNATEIRKNSLY
jgi:hypothetical protein